MKRLGIALIDNERGGGLIAVIIGLTVAVLSYSAYTASSYVLMMTESKRQKRQLVGYEAMHQLAKTLEEARQRDAESIARGVTDCSDQPIANQKVGDFCLSNNNCIDNPLDPTQSICFGVNSAGAGQGETQTIEISGVDKDPSFFKSLIKPMHEFNHWFGEKGYMVAKAFVEQAPVAQAVVRRIYLPEMPANVPVITFDSGGNTALNTSCAPGYAPPAGSPLNNNFLCMPCAETTGAPSGVGRAACVQMKVCIRGITIGGSVPFSCDPGTDEHWLWQTVAVTSPLVLVP